MRAVEYKSFERIKFFVSYDLEKLSWWTWKNYLGGPGKPGNDLEFRKLKSLDTLNYCSNIIIIMFNIIIGVYHLMINSYFYY